MQKLTQLFLCPQATRNHDKLVTFRGSISAILCVFYCRPILTLAWFTHVLDIYCVSFPKDHRLLKLVVFVQILLETVQTITSTYDLFQHFTVAYTDMEAIIEVGTIWISIPLMIGLSTCVTIASSANSWKFGPVSVTLIASCIRYSVVLLLLSRHTDAIKICSGFNRHGESIELCHWNRISQWPYFGSSHLDNLQQQLAWRYKTKIPSC